MSGKYALFTPENESETKEFTEAELEMDTLIASFRSDYLSWGERHIQLGARDSAVRECVFEALTEL